MSETPTREQWADIARRLQEPFDPNEVEWRVQGKVNEQTGKAQVVAYIDARSVAARLDDVVGIGNWSFDWEPLVTERGEVQIAKGMLTIYGVAKADAGTASNFEPTLGAVSHCLKRAAVHWGIGRYLYRVEGAWVPVEKNGRIPRTELARLRDRLPKPGQPLSAATARDDDDDSADARPAQRSAPAQASQRAPAPMRPREGAPAQQDAATEQQMTAIGKLCTALGTAQPTEALTYAAARELITKLSGEWATARASGK